jgi:uroporphyrinogen decarboxylase
MYEKGLTREQYKQFGVPYDLQAIQPALDKCWFNMLHVHGDKNLYFDIAKDYPFQAFNWEDILSGQSLGEVHQLIPDKILVAGLCRHNDFRVGNREEQLQHIINRVKQAAAQVPANQLIIAGGCAQDTDIPDYRYDTLREAMETLYGPYDV